MSNVAPKFPSRKDIKQTTKHCKWLKDLHINCRNNVLYWLKFEPMKLQGQWPHGYIKLFFFFKLQWPTKQHIHKQDIQCNKWVTTSLYIPQQTMEIRIQRYIACNRFYRPSRQKHPHLLLHLSCDLVFLFMLYPGAYFKMSN